jgi:hypothetical protein
MCSIRWFPTAPIAVLAALCSCQPSRPCVLDAHCGACEACRNGGCEPLPACVPDAGCPNDERACAEVGATDCIHGQIRTCRSEDGCVTWGPYQSCPEQACRSTTACGACTWECTRFGETTCANARLTACVSDWGCLTLSTSDCPSDPHGTAVCVDGAHCGLECASGYHACGGQCTVSSCEP